MNSAYLGIIEGFFGKTWDWSVRQAYTQFLKQYGYEFYIYAPKADQYLRHQWRSPWPQDQWASLYALRAHYQQEGILFGVGFSPFEAYRDFGDDTKQALKVKIQELNELDLDILSIQFDDMRGDVPNLAQTQIQMTQWIIEHSHAKHFIFCPTYYSDDPVLERVFGQCPQGYLETLKSLDPSIDFYWTGPKVCSTEYPMTHLKEVAEKLGRKPFLWDNYPVNDGEKMCTHLHLDAFTERHHWLKDYCSGHAVNPMNQALLSQIPLFTLAEAYQQGEAYQPQKSFERACQVLLGDTPLGKTLGQQIQQDLPLLHYQGLSKFSEQERQDLIKKYQDLTTPYSQEVVDWLRGEYRFDPACLTETE